MADPTSFFIRGDDNLEYGPVELDELREWVQENRAGLGTTVRYDQEGALWQPWQYYPELVALLAEVRTGVPSGANPLVIAPMGRRALALVLDFFLSSFLFTPVFSVVMTAFMPDYGNEVRQLFSNAYHGVDAPVSALVYAHIQIASLLTYIGLVMYMAGFNAAYGRTPGKAMLGIRVVSPNGAKPTPLKAMLRAVVFAISCYFFLFLPLAYAFVSPQRRALHDWVADTLVVRV